jgi:hypothetical protein
VPGEGYRPVIRIEGSPVVLERATYGQTGAGNAQAQGFRHLVHDGHASEDASADNRAFIDALRRGGDAQLGLWTDKAVKQGLNKRQIDENVLFNLAATRPDLLTGFDPASGKPAPFGASGVDINCAVIGFTSKPPTADLADR